MSCTVSLNLASSGQVVTNEYHLGANYLWVSLRFLWNFALHKCLTLLAVQIKLL